MTWVYIVTGAGLLVAFANGANDNFKGVATLLGTGLTDYPRALYWATLMTAAGSVTAFFFASALVKTFSGKGLIPQEFINEPDFLGAVAMGAGLTVLLASRFGVPVSTTHGITGSLVGAGYMAAGSKLNILALGKNFVAPLLVSPFLAMAFSMGLYALFHYFQKSMGITRSTCVCVEENLPAASLPAGFNLAGRQLSQTAQGTFGIIISEKQVCETRVMERYDRQIFGVSAQRALNGLHFVSAGAVSFARGLNDTPKIVALLTVSSFMDLRGGILAVASAMALGGLLSANRVAETVSHRITAMNHGQGFTANLVTAILVIFASQMGVPVSTTHVSCGALFGIGVSRGHARWPVIASIAGAWLLTLPMAALLSAMSYFIFCRLGPS